MTASQPGSAVARPISVLLNQALDLILHDEGGYAERANEHGGAVNKGVSFTTFALWRHVHGCPAPTFADLKAMSVDEAKAIYAAQFAAPVHFDAMPVGSGYVLLDSAVNNGVGGAAQNAEMATGHTVDGKWDAAVFWACVHREPAAFINAFCDARAIRQKHFRDYEKRIDPAKKRTWGDAWDERNERVRRRALGMLPVKGAR